MPSDPLQLFRALLQTLAIPLTPPSIPSIPPSLLLLTLERILGERITLTPDIRSCRTRTDELALVKCLLGIMADDELGMDLTAVDPTRVVEGRSEEMGVIIMGMVVIAKRRGWEVRPGAGRGDESFDSMRSGRSAQTAQTVESGSSARTTGTAEVFANAAGRGRGDEDWSRPDGSHQFDEDDCEWDGLVGDDDEMDVGAYARPLEPDVTLSSPVIPVSSRDVFGELAARPQQTNGLFSVEHDKLDPHFKGAAPYDAQADLTLEHYVGNDNAYETPMPRNGLNVPLVRSGPDHKADDADIADGQRQIRPTTRELRDALAYEKVANWREDSQTTATSTTLAGGSSGHRTVLQEMMDEFGLG